MFIKLNRIYLPSIFISLEYPFAKFNKKVNVIEYSDEEYEINLQDPGWSKEETDYLINMCRQYDLRFFVIYDRYEFPGRQRTIEVGFAFILSLLHGCNSASRHTGYQGSLL